MAKDKFKIRMVFISNMPVNMRIREKGSAFPLNSLATELMEFCI